MINFDLLVAGCDTACRHCYVRGGAGPLMPFSDIVACLERLEFLASMLPGEAARKPGLQRFCQRPLPRIERGGDRNGSVIPLKEKREWFFVTKMIESFLLP